MMIPKRTRRSIPTRETLPTRATTLPPPRRRRRRRSGARSRRSGRCPRGRASRRGAIASGGRRSPRRRRRARADEARAAREKRLRAEERSAVANRAKERAAKLKGGDKARDRGRSDRRRRRNRTREGGEGGGGGADDGGTPDRPSGIAGDFDGVEEFDDIGATSAGGVEYDDGGDGDGGDGFGNANENGRGGGERSRYRPSYFGGSDRGSDDDSARSARLGEGGSPGDSGYSDDGHAFSGVGGVRSPRRPPEANRRRFVFGEASEAVFPDAFAMGGEAAAAEADRARERRPPRARGDRSFVSAPAGAPEERGRATPPPRRRRMVAAAAAAAAARANDARALVHARARERARARTRARRGSTRGRARGERRRRRRKGGATGAFSSSSMTRLFR